MYAITGVTGKVGGATARALLAAGQSVGGAQICDRGGIDQHVTAGDLASGSDKPRRRAMAGTPPVGHLARATESTSLGRRTLA